MPRLSEFAPGHKPAVLSFDAELLELRSSRAAAEARSRQMLAAITAFRDGDFSVRLPADWTGTDARIAEAFNQALAHDERISREVGRLSASVGKEGRLKQRMSLPGAIGGWATTVDSLNTLIDDLVRPTTEIARTIGAVAKGDLGQSMELEVDGRALKGEFLRSAKLVNSMIEQLSVFTSEVTRVAREVGTEGKLGGQAKVKGVSGVWKELTDSVNQMAGNLTAQVRNIADVTIAVANGDLSKKITVDVRGEILQSNERGTCDVIHIDDRHGSRTGGPAAASDKRKLAGERCLAPLPSTQCG
jgi:HAMP domain-containing protein